MAAGGILASGRRRTLVAGLLVAAAYAGVYIVSLRTTERHARPLYDGFAPSAPYRWMDPPAGYEQGNVKPTPSTAELPLGDQGLAMGQAASDDAQIILNLPDGAVPPHPGDSTVKVVLTPLAPDKLGSLPDKRYAAGNAYRIEMSYQPSGQKIETLDKAGNVILVLPWPGNGMLRSADGEQWENIVGATHSTGAGMAAPVSALGYFLGFTDLPVGAAAAESDGSSSVWLIALVVAALAAALVAVPVLVRRSRRQKAAQKAIARQRSSGARRPERRPPSRPGSRPPSRPTSSKKKKRKR